MRKHFLILMLFALLPLSGWAVDFSDPTVTASANDAVFNTAIQTIKNGITVRINGGEPLAANKWLWNGVYYNSIASADAESASGVVAAADGSTTPNVGTYYIRIEAASQENSGHKTIALVVKGAPLVADADKDYVAPTPEGGLVYDGTEKTLIAAATYGTTGSLEKCGAITYTIGTKVGQADPSDAGCTYSAALPKATAAGTYYVFYKFAGSTNYAEAKGFVQVVISGKDINHLTATTPAGNNFKMNAENSYTYSGKSQAPTFTVKDGNTDISSSVDVYWFPENYNFALDLADVDVEHDAVTTIGAGTYKAMLVGKDNYAGRKIGDTWTFTIAQKDLTLIINDLESTYDGQNVSLANAGITYYGLCSTDFAASLNNFGKLSVVFADGQDHKDVAYNNNAVTGHALQINLGEEYENTSLFKNYNLKNANGQPIHVTPAVQQTLAYIDNATGKYTIQPKAVTYKARNIEMEYGSNEPANPGAATLDVADDPTTELVDETAVGNVEITDGGMVEGEKILDAIKFIVAEKAVPAAGQTPALDWNKAVAGQTYANTLTLALMTQENINAMPGTSQAEQNAKAAAQAAFDKAKNYAITWEKGAVSVVGKSLTVYVNGSSVQYGADLTNYNPGYYASGKTLGGTITYTICDVDTEEPVEDLVNLPRGTYLVKMNEGYTDPANYHVVAVEAGYLEVVRKKIEITINPLVLNQGATKALLNERASVQDYTSQLVGDDTEVTFTYAFNANATLDTDANIHLTLNNDNLAANAVAGSYSKGIVAGVIAWDPNQDEAANIEAGWVAANDNYEVTFVEGKLTVVAGGVLYLTRSDEYLTDKIQTAATACAADPEHVFYAVSFDARELKAETWQAMAFPFDLTVAEFNKAILAATNDKGYAVVNILNEENTADKPAFKLWMREIPANTPFLFKIYNGKNNDETLKAFDMKDLMFQDKTIVYAEQAESEDAAGNKFYGIYKNTTVTNDGLTWLFNHNTGKFSKYEGTSRNLAPLTGYLTTATEIDAFARITVVEEDGTITAISNINADGSAVEADGWYTLNGVKLQGAPTEKGVYINNGKKVVIK